MAQNLVMFDPADNEWCVVCRIGSIGDDPKTTVAFYKTQDEANEAAATTRLMKYTRYIRDLREGDVLCCHKIDMILNYFERELDSDAIREEV